MGKSRKTTKYFHPPQLTNPYFHVIFIVEKERFMNLRKIRGFTLIEILTVICIIIILIGLLQPALRRVREQARVQEARATIGSLEVAINMYYTDTGSYPSETSSWESILVNGAGSYGPYMDNRDYVTATGNFTDPWNRAYIYAQPGTQNPSTFDISSQGPDAGVTTDDIGNW